MMQDEARECSNCGYPVTYWIISDAHDPEVSRQFVFIELQGQLKGLPVTGGSCPQCNAELTLATTRKAPVKAR